MSTHALAGVEAGIVPEWTRGDRMRKALESAGVSVEEMAEICDVSRQTIGRWMHDKSPVRRATLVIWSLTTGVDLEWLQAGELRACRDSNPKPSDP